METERFIMEVEDKETGKIFYFWPNCGANFQLDSPNWGREVCGHCGQKLNWAKVSKDA